MELNSGQIKRLRAEGHRLKLKPVVTIGQKGLTENLHNEIDQALSHHELVKLRIPARDVSICLQAPEKTSILNIFKAKITEIEDNTSPRQLIRLQIGQQFLLARLTRKSIVTLELGIGDTVYAQIKSVAL